MTCAQVRLLGPCFKTGQVLTDLLIRSTVLPLLTVLTCRADCTACETTLYSSLPLNSQAKRPAQPSRRCCTGSIDRYQALKEHCVLATDLLYSRSAAQAQTAKSKRRIASICSSHDRQLTHDHKPASPTRGNTRFPTSGFTLFELSLQSSFQLSLTLLVRYRSRSHI